jgi:hypothetical protein
MGNDLCTTDLRFTPAPSWWPDKELLGWASCVVDDRVALGGLGVRRGLRGEYELTFPGPRIGTGHRDSEPRDDETRRSIEAQVLGELRRQGMIP